MRPPLLSEATIRAAIHELAERHSGRVTGSAVRDLLAARFGARGGVARVYRLLGESRVGASPAAKASGSRQGETPAPPDPASREEAVSRATLAEHRERVHQERWARETDQLRTRLAAAEQVAREAGGARQRVAELTRALASAQARIAALERAAASSTGTAA